MKNNDQVSGKKTYFSCLDIYESSTIYDLDQEVEDTEYSSFAHQVGSELLSRYIILKVLKENKFGFIYLVERINKNTKFIIKEFFPHEYVTRNDQSEMIINTPLDIEDLIRFNYMQNFFMGEANNLEKISITPHSNIIKIASVEKNRNNTTYIIYPYEEGMTLQRYMKIKERLGKVQLDNSEIDKILKPLIDAIEHLHTLNIYHLNIKPENILIKKNGSLLLLGFEASVFFHDEDSRVFCNAYTLQYVSPEQINVYNYSNIGKESDVYAVGVLLYKVVTGNYPPHAQERITCQKKDVAYDPYIFLQEKTQLLKKYNFLLLSVIDRSMMFSRKERFDDVGSFRKALYVTPVIKRESFIENKRNFFLYFILLLVSIYIIFEGLSRIGNDSIVGVNATRQNIEKSEENRSLLQIQNEDTEKVSRNMDDKEKRYPELTETIKTKDITLNENTLEEVEDTFKTDISLSGEIVEEVPVRKEVKTVFIDSVSIDINETVFINIEDKKKAISQEFKSNIIVKTKKKRVIRKKKTKKKTNIQRKKPSVKNSSGLVWYCKATAGNIRTSAKSSNKARSKNMALGQCRKRAGSKKYCRILNCFLLR